MNHFDAVMYSLVEQMANDPNSSTLREEVTKWVLGKEASKSKLGYDDDVDPIEVKPKNYTGGKKLNGSGSFNDLTWKRHEKYLNDSAIVVSSGFVYGKLVYIVQFEYKDIQPRILKYLNKHLPDGDLPNRYVRYAPFSYMDWKGKPFSLVYKSEKFDTYKPFIVKNLFTLINNCPPPLTPDF